MKKHVFRALGALLLGMNPASLDPDALLKEVKGKHGNYKQYVRRKAMHKGKTTVEMIPLAEGIR